MKFLKAIYGGKIIGAVRGYTEGNVAHIKKLVVNPDYQNQGVGQELLEAIEKAFLDVKKFELHTGHKSLKNLYIYQKNGYQEFKRVKVDDSLIVIHLYKKF